MSFTSTLEVTATTTASVDFAWDVAFSDCSEEGVVMNGAIAYSSAVVAGDTGAEVALVVAVALGAFGGAAPALGAEDDLAEGLRLFAELEYEAAMPRLAAAKLDSARAPSDRAQAALHLAIIQITLGDEASSRRNLGEAARLDPAVALPIGSSPRLQELLEAARAEVGPGAAPAPAPAAAAAAAAEMPGAGGGELPDGRPSSLEASLAAGAPPPPRVEEPLYTRWWLWTIIGSLVVGATVATVLGVTLGDRGPRGDCGSPSGQGCLVVTVQ